MTEQLGPETILQLTELVKNSLSFKDEHFFVLIKNYETFDIVDMTISWKMV